jgi:hypothetical protein
MRSDGSQLLDQKQPRREGALGHFPRAGPGCGPFCFCATVTSVAGRFFRVIRAEINQLKSKKKGSTAGPAPSQLRSPELGRKRPWAKLVCCGLIKHSEFFLYSI